MSNKVCLETSIVSYLTARRSRDLMAAAAQQATLEWWEQQRQRFMLYISPVVLDEAAEGDSKAAAKRTRALQNIPILPLTPAVLNLSEAFMVQKVLSPKAE